MGVMYFGFYAILTPYRLSEFIIPFFPQNRNQVPLVTFIAARLSVLLVQK